MTLVQSCRSLIFSGYLDEATDVLDELEQFTAPFDSNMMTTIINEIRAQFCRANGDFEQAAQLLDDVVRRRSGYLELSNMNLLARFHALSMHVHNGDPVPAAEVRHSWDLLERHGRGPQSFRAASATAIWLTQQDQRELGVRYLRWAARLGDTNRLTVYQDELDRFDLPVNPDGPDEQLDDLIAELDFI